MANEKGDLFFEMPPIIGDPSLPYKRAIQVISADFGREAEQAGLSKSLKSLHQVVLRLPLPDSLLFHAALESEQLFPYAYLIARLPGLSDNVFADVGIVELRTIQVIAFEEYHGDIIVGLEFKKISIIRGSYFLFLKALKAYKTTRHVVRDVLRSLPGF
jgi:hypothetical protein